MLEQPMIRPPHQLRADYVSHLQRGGVLDRFQRRLEPENYTIDYFDALRRDLEAALVSAPSTYIEETKFALAFTMLQNRASVGDVERAQQLLSEVSRTSFYRDGDVHQLNRLADAVRLRADDGRLGFVVERVNWSVNNYCPMVCRGCYNPFTGKQLSLDEAVAITDKLAEHGTRYLVLSGGDPLLWEHVFDLVEHAVSRNIDVALDTTGYTLDEAKLRRLQGKISSLRLPIDGSTNEIQRAFRRSRDSNLVDRFRHSLRLCSNADFCDVRVHTVVSKKNIDDLFALADLVLSERSVAEWVLFQWWGRRAPQHITEEMLIDADAIAKVVEELKRRHPDKKVFFASAEERELVNFFIQSNGQVVTFASGYSEEFIIGDLVNEDIHTVVARPLLTKDSLIQGWGWSEEEQ
ncbi:radical SAM protein [Streptomyces sp. NPDC091217]|uniref:radical SAM protein n=1 Tax=Streptomyces sp. NPDC091217 TaxID=3365975 RepID=UPI00382AB49E